MYCPEHFREERLEVLHSLIKAHPLGLLVTAGRAGVIANLLPFTIHAEGERGTLRAHLARANRQVDALKEAAETLVIFQGPECYVSPGWYPSRAQDGRVTPSWNYTMVQVRGTPRACDDRAWVRAQVEQMTDIHEGPRPAPWKVSEAPESHISEMLNHIVGFEIPVRGIEGKWKISQNRTEADRDGVMSALTEEQSCPGMLATMKARYGMRD
jgi:transcriptional regulator